MAIHYRHLVIFLSLICINLTTCLASSRWSLYVDSSTAGALDNAPSPDTPPNPGPPSGPTPNVPDPPGGFPPPPPPPLPGSPTGPSNELTGGKGGSSGGMNGGKVVGIVIAILAGAGMLWFGATVYKKRRSNIQRARFGAQARTPML